MGSRIWFCELISSIFLVISVTRVSQHLLESVTTLVSPVVVLFNVVLEQCQAF